MYIPIILICSLSMPSSECKENKEGVTVAVGEHKSTPMACLIEGQTKAASLAFAPQLGDGYYVHVKCVPKTIAD